MYEYYRNQADLSCSIYEGGARSLRSTRMFWRFPRPGGDIGLTHCGMWNGPVLCHAHYVSEYLVPTEGRNSSWGLPH